jgi:hypothetical protein
MTSHGRRRSFAMALLATLATGISDCGSTSDSSEQSCIRDFQCPADPADLGETCKPKCGATSTSCTYHDPCYGQSVSCFLPYDCVNGKWKSGDICAKFFTCPEAPPKSGDSCCALHVLPNPCIYGDCAAGDLSVTRALCASTCTLCPGAWTVTTEPCS